VSTRPSFDAPPATPFIEPAGRDAVLDALPTGVALLDRRGHIAYVNPAWRELATATRPGERDLEVGGDYPALWARAQAANRSAAGRIADGLRAILAGAQRRLAQQYPLPSPTGPRWVHLVAAGSIPGYGAAVIETEVTEHVLAQEDLRESERRYGGMLDNLELATVMLDREARITYCNPFLLRLVGWQLDEVVGRDWFETFTPESVGEMRPVFAELLQNLPQAWHHDNALLTRSGERRMVRWSNSVLRDAAGAVVGTASIGEDITERERADAVLARRAAELERFHRLSVGRELQMIALKKQVNALAVQAGQAAPYDLAFLGAGAAADLGKRDADGP
jgi:PAS domain S-box-containing protein